MAKPSFNVCLPTIANDNYHDAAVKGVLIKGDKINLRPFDTGDADFLYKWENDPEYTGRYEPFEPVTLVELKEWLPREKPGILWHMIETKGGEKLGQIVARLQEDGSYQVGYRVIPPARGRGVCTEAVRTLVRHLFASGVHRVVAEANPENTPSIKVLTKLGFRKIEYKERAVEVNGIWLDGITFELRSD